MVQYEVKITGRVQGVCFRDFVQKRAREHEISGWVRNEPDGSVRVRAEGDEAAMNTFMDYLKRGPSRARVENLSKNRLDFLSGFSGFQIKY